MTKLQLFLLFYGQFDIFNMQNSSHVPLFVYAQFEQRIRDLERQKIKLEKYIQELEFNKIKLEEEVINLTKNNSLKEK